VRKARHATLPKLLRAEIPDRETCHAFFRPVYPQARGALAAGVLAPAAGARGSRSRVEDLGPHAVPTLDSSPAKHSPGEAGQPMDGQDSAFVRPWGKEPEALLREDKAVFRTYVEQVLALQLQPGQSVLMCKTRVLALQTVSNKVKLWITIARVSTQEVRNNILIFFSL
jgi:hypothetical protein